MTKKSRNITVSDMRSALSGFWMISLFLLMFIVGAYKLYNWLKSTGCSEASGSMCSTGVFFIVISLALCLGIAVIGCLIIKWSLMDEES